MARGSRNLWGMGLGAGLVGAAAIGLRYLLRPPRQEPVPDSISPAIFATKVLHTSIGEVVYHESGGGDPLIFVHGISVGASSYEWSKVYPDFASRYRVMAPDLVGFGESARPKASLSEADYVRSLAEFCRATCGDRKPVLIGSGLGGGFCAHLASQHPELVSRLILLMPTGLGDFGRQRLPWHTKLLSQTPGLNGFIYRNYLSTRAAVRTWLTQSGFADARRLTEETVEVYATCAQQYGAQYAVFNFLSGRLNFDLDLRMRSLTQPATLLWGDRATFPPMEWAERLQGALRNCQLVMLKGVGSLAALEDPKQVIEVVRDQLRGELRIYKAG